MGHLQPSYEWLPPGAVELSHLNTAPTFHIGPTVGYLGHGRSCALNEEAAVLELLQRLHEAQRGDHVVEVHASVHEGVEHHSEIDIAIVAGVIRSQYVRKMETWWYT